MNPVNTPHIYNVTLTTKDTEYSQLLPNGTKKFRMWAVNSGRTAVHGAVLKTCFTSGKSGNIFIPIPAGNYHEEKNLNLRGKTLYFQSPTGSAVVIIIAWT